MRVLRLPPPPPPPHRCISIGGVLGLIAGRITKSSLLYSAASSAFFGAYAATLSNQLGKTVRLVGVVAVALVSRLVEYVSESYRSATFVYQTGRWFERIDTSLQALDQNMGSPSKRWDAVTGFLASEVSANVGKAANGTIQSVRARTHVGHARDVGGKGRAMWEARGGGDGMQGAGGSRAPPY